MDTTLIVNPGSSSKKYALYRESTEIFSALFEHTEHGYARCVEINRERRTCEGVTEGQYEDALRIALEHAIEVGSITQVNDVTRVGIRIVAPGSFFTTHRIIDTAYMRQLALMRDAAPLHIPHQLSELTLVRDMFSNARIIGVSDSAFHATMPAHARRYSIPRGDAEAFDLYKFGYHGLSVASIVRQISREEGKVPARVVVCHVGSGVSVTALMDGKSIDTTMGFAPTSGLMMSARAGELDPSALLYLLKKKGNNSELIEHLVSEEGGIKGILKNSDLRIALDRSARGEYEATVAVEMFMGGIRKAIGSMAAVLGGMDVLVLTGTASERNSLVRKCITTNFEYCGIEIDDKANEMLSERAGVFSKDGSRVAVRVMHTNELHEIAEVAATF